MIDQKFNIQQPKLFENINYGYGDLRHKGQKSSLSPSMSISKCNILGTEQGKSFTFVSLSSVHLRTKQGCHIKNNGHFWVLFYVCFFTGMLKSAYYRTISTIKVSYPLSHTHIFHYILQLQIICNYQINQIHISVNLSQ